MSMKVFNRSQILMLTVLALLLTVAPFLSPSFRSTYLYLVTNFLIVALGAEAGLLSAFSRPSSDDHKKQHPLSVSVIQKPVVLLQEQVVIGHDQKGPSAPSATFEEEIKPIQVESSASEKIVSAVKMDEQDHGKVKKYCSLVPSLFFIGGGETEGEESDEEKWEEEQDSSESESEEVGGGADGQELSAKAEAFIGSFYKQLKMQREESWKRIHGIYQRGF